MGSSKRPSSGFSRFRSPAAFLIIFAGTVAAWSVIRRSQLFLRGPFAISQNKGNKSLVESSVLGDDSILVTGVAGYIGSLTTLQLLEDGYDVVGLDNMSRGSQQALNLLSKYENFHFEHVDLRNKDAVDSVFWKYDISAVLHLAAYSFVLESVDDPTLYKLNNEMATDILVNSMTEHAVSSLVFSSSCAVYGNASVFPITENTPTLPISPYGESKLASEKIILARAAAASKPTFRARILRYFNVVGADSKARLGENPRADSAKYGRLWTSCMNVAFGRASCVSIGRDETYRDFIHVEDVVRANIAALQNIVDNVTPDDSSSQHGQQNTQIWNVATNEATSIKLFVATAESVVGMGMDIPICSKTTKQAGAPDNLTGTQASVVQGSAELLTSMTGWKPQYTNLKDILTTAWNYSKGRQKETAVIMFDTRSLEVDSNSSYMYWRWAAELNYHYARRHDYDFIYIHAETSSTPEAVDVQMDGENSVHKTRVQCYVDIPSKNITLGRGASWCKLLGVASTFERGYSRVVFIDSDAFFKADAPDIDTLVRTTRENRTGLDPLLWFPQNSPWGGNLPNAAMHIWQTTSTSAWRFLRHWWQINASPQMHAYEQDALWKLLEGSKKMNVCGAGLLSKLPWMEPGQFAKLPVAHVASAYRGQREQIIRSEFEKIHNASNNDVHSKVSVMTVAESKRVQHLLAGHLDNVAC